MLKKPLWRVRTNPTTPTIKKGKFVITFKVLGTPVRHPPDIKKHQLKEKR